MANPRRAAKILLLIVAPLSSCSRELTSEEESAPLPKARADGTAIVTRTAQARVDEIMKRTRIARDDGTMSVLTRPGEAPPPRLMEVLTPGRVERLDPNRRGLDPVMVQPDRAALKARVTLPASATGAFHVEDTTTGRVITIRLQGARTADVELARGLAIWRGGAPEGGDLIAHASDVGLEDYVAFDARPAAERLVYHVDVSAFAGVRLVDRVIELLDEKGAPRLRMARPYVAGADARRVEASVSVSGCAYDTDPRPPYDRAVTPPGSSICAVTIGWSGAAYPLLVDPTWTATAGVMTSPRTWHTASLLAEGKVLIAGGSNITNVIASAEVFDPATGTCAAIAPMSTPRAGHAMGWRLATGGINAGTPPATLASAEFYKVDMSGWTTTAPMKAPRAYHAMAGFTSTGEFLVAGDTTADRFNIANNGTFTAADPTSESKRYHVGLQISPTEVWMVGGYRWNGANVNQTSIDVYNSAGTRTKVLTMPHEHAQGGAAVLTGGAVLVHTGLGTGTTFADVYQNNVWTSTSRPWRRDHRVVGLPDGTALIIGHDIDAERYDPISKAFSFAGNNVIARQNHTATVLGDGRVVVTGGHQPGASPPVYNGVEVFAAGANGAACTSGGECASLACVEGVCCNTACTGACQSCLKLKQGATGIDGTCGAVAAGTDPDDDCGADPKSTCARDGTCDGVGGCRKWASNTPCGSTCTGSTQTNLGCNGSGACDQMLGTISCAPGQCAPDGVQCFTTCTNSSQCAVGYYCDGSACAKQKNNGASCSSDEQCGTGTCAAKDGICCDSACSGVCDGCTSASKGYGVDGECGPVRDTLDPYAECTPDPANPCGETGLCDGNHQCAKASPNVACGAASCLDASTAAASKCDGNGMCVEIPSGERCGAYACDDAEGACKASCAASTDCSTHNYCDGDICLTAKDTGDPCATDDQCFSGRCAEGTCVEGKTCDGDHTLLLPGGTTKDCAPYRCSTDGACHETCASTVDCATGTACNAEGKCTDEPMPAPVNDCACRTDGGDGTSGGGPSGAIAIAIAAAAMRRRRARKSVASRRDAR